MSDWQVYAERRWRGKRVPRLEDPGMLTGATRYVTDARAPHMLELSFVRSPLPHARIVSVDLSAVEGVPGVRAVLHAGDLAHVRDTVDFVHMDGARKTYRPVLARERVRYVGEPVVAVIGEDRYAAEDGAEAVYVEYEPLGTGEPLHEDIPDDFLFCAERAAGDLDEAFAGAERVIQRRLHIARVATSAMETCGILAEFDAGSGELTCQLATQMPHGTRAGLAAALGLPVSAVRVLCPAMGGAFGGKEVVLPEYLCAAAAAIRLNRPVRWVQDRTEALSAGAHGKETEAELEAAFAADGRLRGMRSRFVSDTGAYSSEIGAYVEFMVAAHTVPGLYRLPAYGFTAANRVSAKAPLSPFRGVGMTTSQTLREVLLDDAARAFGIDRMELRRRNIVEDGSWRTVLGEEYEPGSWRTAFERVLELVDYDAFLRRQSAERERGRRLGLGVSPFVEMAAFGSGGAAGLEGASNDSATVSIDTSGTITVALPTFSHGQGHRTTVAQLAADIFSVTPQDVRVIDGDTARTPYGMGTFGSRSGVYSAGTVARAGAIVREKLLRAAGALLEATPEDLELVDGQVGVRGAPSSRRGLADIAQAAQFSPRVRAELGDPTLTASGFFDPIRPTHSNGAIAAVVEVDPDTGAVVVERIVVVEDCGAMINPMIVDGQIRGGVAQGVGLALLERIVYDDACQPQSSTFAEYLLPRATDLPHRIEIEHLETPSEHAPAGVKGMAEGPASATPAAIVCAVLDAIAPAGDDIEELPLRPETIADAAARNTASLTQSG